MKLESQNCPWHVADLDGLYVVRDKNDKIIFEHAQDDYPRERKLEHVLLAAAAPDLILSLCEMVLLLDTPYAFRRFQVNKADFKIAVDRARAAILRTSTKSPPEIPMTAKI
jgi:hypothetical protein